MTWHACRAHLQHGCFDTPLGTCAGDRLLAVGELLDVTDSMDYLCGASVPLTVDLFCGGVLGALLRMAQRVVATQAHAHEKERITGDLLSKGLASVVETFGVAVPQARAHPLPVPAQPGISGHW